MARAWLRCLRLHPTAAPLSLAHRQPYIFPCLFVIYTLPVRPAGQWLSVRTQPSLPPPPSLSPLPGRPLRFGNGQPAPPASTRFSRPKPRLGPFYPCSPSFCQCGHRSGGCRRCGPARCLLREPAGKYRNKLRGGHGTVPASLLRSREGVSRGFLVGLSPQVGPVPLHRVGPSEMAKPPRFSPRKCIKNRRRRRVCLKSGQHQDISAFHLSLFTNRLMTVTNNLVSETCNFIPRG